MQFHRYTNLATLHLITVKPHYRTLLHTTNPSLLRYHHLLLGYILVAKTTKIKTISGQSSKTNIKGRALMVIYPLLTPNLDCETLMSEKGVIFVEKLCSVIKLVHRYILLNLYHHRFASTESHI